MFSFTSILYVYIHGMMLGIGTALHLCSVLIIMFGSVMQKEACVMAWNLLVGQYGVKPSSLYVTYFGGDSAFGLGPDLETRDIWRQIG
jgi:hypothetical protein